MVRLHSTVDIQSRRSAIVARRCIHRVPAALAGASIPNRRGVFLFGHIPRISLVTLCHNPLVSGLFSCEESRTIIEEKSSLLDLTRERKGD